MEWNGFNFIVVWIVKEEKESNGNNSYLDKERKRKERNVV